MQHPDRLRVINFSQDWNGKLCNDYFTTVRLDSSFRVDEEVQINLSKKPFKVCKIVLKKPVYINAINDWFAYIDSGYDAAYMKSILLRMYGKKVRDWSQTPLTMYLLETTDALP